MPELRFEDHQGLCAHMARKAHHRLVQRGLDVELEDLIQEAAIVFMRCREKFRPELGFRFSTYLGRAILNELSYERIGKRRSRWNEVSLDDTAGEEGATTWHERIGSSEYDAASIVERQSEFAAIMRRLSPRARLAVGLLVDPPAELRREIERARAFAERAGAAGYPRPNFRIDVPTIGAALGWPARERSRVSREIRAILTEET